MPQHLKGRVLFFFFFLFVCLFCFLFLVVCAPFFGSQFKDIIHCGREMLWSQEYEEAGHIECVSGNTKIERQRHGQ